MPELIYNDIPAVYDIGVGESDPCLLVKVQSKAMDYVEDILKKPYVPLVSNLKEELKLPIFILPTKDGWGFGSVLNLLPTEDLNTVTFKCALPASLGRGRANWNVLYEISSSLNILFNCLSIVEEKTDSTLPQLFHLDLYTAKTPHGGSLNAYLGRSVMPWLSKQPDNVSHQDIEGTMRKTFLHLSGRDPDFLGKFMAWTRQPCWINLTCPGDACGLDPIDYNDPRPFGYELLPHNIDNPLQQLTLIMGLAKMHDLARQSGY